MKMKKMFSFFIACFLLVTFAQLTRVEAAKGDLAGEEKSEYAIAISDLQKTELMGGVTLYKQQIRRIILFPVLNCRKAWI